MYDAVVIGSGFGGLAAGLRLVEDNKKVLLCESLKYPGGCASTFEKKNLNFESGATLFSGFGEGQLFEKWRVAHQLPITFSLLSPTILFRLPEHNISIFPNREKTIQGFCNIPNAPTSQIRAFFAYQKQIADILWPVFDDPYRLPPFSLNGLWWHICRSWKYLRLLPLINTPLINILKKFDLHNFSPFVQYCNALCQITIQTDIQHAEAPFALCTMDYMFRGTGHIQGGVGNLAQAMVQRIEDLGGDIRMPGRVKAIKRQQQHWSVQIRNESIATKSIIANILPSGLERLLNTPLPKPEHQLQKRVEEGWGAVLLYLIIKDDPSLPSKALHIQCIGDPRLPLLEGNHIFCSLGASGENLDPNLRTATVSTHIAMPKYQNHNDIPQLISAIQSAMKTLIQQQIPEIYPHILEYLPASPRTFARFTSRAQGCVGGIPRRKGWKNYQGLWPKPTHPNLWLVGDSVFPGQSTLSTAIGGYRTASAVIKALS